jgi:hypothetical protein
MLGRIYHGPWDWLITATSARDRRSFAGWVLLLSVLFSPFFGGRVFYVTALSIIALGSNVTSETPVVSE